MSDTKTLPPFREEGHTCQKCWNDDVSFVYHEGDRHSSHYPCAAVELLETSRPGEHICLSCSRCHHRWAMKTADAEDG